jgi:hypothetical protein
MKAVRGGRGGAVRGGRRGAGVASIGSGCGTTSGGCADVEEDVQEGDGNAPSARAARAATRTAGPRSDNTSHSPVADGGDDDSRKSPKHTADQTANGRASPLRDENPVDKTTKRKQPPSRTPQKVLFMFLPHVSCTTGADRHCHPLSFFTTKCFFTDARNSHSHTGLTLLLQAPIAWQTMVPDPAVQARMKKVMKSFGQKIQDKGELKKLRYHLSASYSAEVHSDDEQVRHATRHAT